MSVFCSASYANFWSAGRLGLVLHEVRGRVAIEDISPDGAPRQPRCPPSQWQCDAGRGEREVSNRHCSQRGYVSAPLRCFPLISRALQCAYIMFSNAYMLIPLALRKWDNSAYLQSYSQRGMPTLLPSDLWSGVPWRGVAWPRALE